MARRFLPRDIRARRDLVFAFFLLNGLGFAIWMARLPGIRSELDLRIEETGFVTICLALGGVLGVSLAGLILRRHSAKTGLIIGLIAMGVGDVLVGVSSSWLGSVPAVAVGLALLGCGSGVLDVTNNVIGAVVERDAGRSTLPRLHAGFSVGGVLGALVGAGTAALQWNTAALFVPIGGVVMIVGLLLVWRLAAIDPTIARPSDRTRRGGGFRGRFREYRDPRLLLICLCLAAFAYAESNANNWIAIGAVDGHGMSETIGAVVYATFVATLTAMRLFGGPLIDRFGRVPVLRAGIVVAIAGFIVFITQPGPIAVFVGAFCWALGIALGLPASIAAAADGENPAGRVAAVSLVAYLAYFTGPTVPGLIAAHTGILLAYLPAIGLLAIAFIAVSATRTRATISKGDSQ